MSNITNLISTNRLKQLTVFYILDIWMFLLIFYTLYYFPFKRKILYITKKNRIMKFRNTKIYCDIKKKSLSTKNMETIKGGDGGWCCGRPPRRRNGNGNGGG